ncbi:hypothetical protein C8F04DRAFT_1193665 [Mycena alexandri]|uniref:Uncharacterized protein n=1 Tax=Mycena alexandri TaxID=1745969 RepID=A0AAD6S961_9AGAR|nr:hypothetical protein C8F04DRAFT_1193665 [Mycena alexandri]
MRAQLLLSLDGVGHLALNSVGLRLGLGDKADGVGLRVRRWHRLCAPPLPGACTWTRKSRWSSSALGHLEDRWREEEREMGMAWACPGREVERSRVEEERGEGKGGRLRDRDEVEYTPAMEMGEGKGSDRDEPEYTLATEMGAHLAGVQEAEGGRGGADEAVGAREAIEEEHGGCAVGPIGGVDVGVGGCIWVLIAGKPHTVCCKNPAGGPEIPARSAGLCALIPVASTKHIAGGRGREPGDGAGVLQRRQHSREKEGFIKHNVLTWIIFACSIVSKPTRSRSIAPTSGGRDDEREGSGPGA